MEPTNPVEIWAITRAIHSNTSSNRQAEVVISDQVKLDTQTSSNDISIADSSCQASDKLHLVVKECTFHPHNKGEEITSRYVIHSGDDTSNKNFHGEITKDEAIRKVAILRTPLGQATPLTMKGMNVYRKTTHLDWDLPISVEGREKWRDLVRQIKATKGLSTDRCILPLNFHSEEMKVLDNNGIQHGDEVANFFRSLLDGRASSHSLLVAYPALYPLGQTTQYSVRAKTHLRVAIPCIAKSTLIDRASKAKAFADSQIDMVVTQVNEINRCTTTIEFHWINGDHVVTKFAIQRSHRSIRHRSVLCLATARRQETVKTYEDVTLVLAASELEDSATAQYPSLLKLANRRRHSGLSEPVRDGMSASRDYSTKRWGSQLVRDKWSTRD